MTMNPTTNDGTSTNHNNDNNNVRLLLTDYDLPSSLSSNHTFNNDTQLPLLGLIQKFSLQQNGRKKFLHRWEHGYEKYFIPIEFTNDKSYLLNALRNYHRKTSESFPWLLEHAARLYYHDREVILEMVKIHGGYVHRAVDAIRNDKEVAMTAVKQDGLAYRRLSDPLRNDKEIILAAVKNTPYLFDELPEEWKNDSDVFLCSVCPNHAHNYSHIQWNNDLLSLFSQLKDDKEFLIGAVKRHPEALQFLSEELKNDAEFILACVSQNGKAFQHASQELRSDKEFVFKALERNWKSFEFASNEIKSDREFILQAINVTGLALEFASTELRTDLDIIFSNPRQVGATLDSALCPTSSIALESFSKLVKDDRNFFLRVVTSCGMYLGMTTSQNFRNDREIVLQAVQQNGRALMFASEALKKDLEIVWTAIANEKEAFSNVSQSLLSDKSFVLQLIRQERLAGVLNFVPPELRNDRQVVMEAMQLESFEWDCFPSFQRFELEPDMVLELVKRTGYTREYRDDLYKARMDYYYYGAYMGMNHVGTGVGQ
ncbi:hypothetical protein C9374_009795 [Naegleria lovaniensis]|uniref:DUF4116 domain-containing protein n=1 Tax=Naegleria lovaniensis TaxID=51637 RepID=A0AA88KPJ4_NAELO|nr:uncharacterized protein C9374_009795 [Naegleria lovaniensis]KAG2393218.1 hypothetical protein C9374_009795 [Naegleria lovaniensis]